MDSGQVFDAHTQVHLFSIQPKQQQEKKKSPYSAALTTSSQCEGGGGLGAGGT